VLKVKNTQDQPGVEMLLGKLPMKNREMTTPDSCELLQKETSRNSKNARKDQKDKNKTLGVSAGSVAVQIIALHCRQPACSRSADKSEIPASVPTDRSKRVYESKVKKKGGPRGTNVRVRTSEYHSPNECAKME